MSYIEEFCDDIAIINGGRVALDGDLSAIKRSYPRDRLAVRTADAEAILRDLGERASLCADGTLLIRLSSEDEKAQMMQRLTCDYEIDEIRVFEPTLNDIFVEYAGDGV